MSRSSLLVAALLLCAHRPANAQPVPLDRPAATSILESLVGEWAIRDERGSQLGTRTVEAGQDALTLEWEENFGEVRLQGFLGYDIAIEKFFQLAVASNEDSRTMFLSGTWDEERRAIRWEPLRSGADSGATNRGLIASIMYLTEPSRLRWAAFDERWSYSFIRQ